MIIGHRHLGQDRTPTSGGSSSASAGGAADPGQGGRRPGLQLGRLGRGHRRRVRDEPVVVVHGAHDLRDALAARLGVPVRTVVSPSGVSSVYTDDDALEVFLMAYPGAANKRIGPPPRRRRRRRPERRGRTALAGDGQERPAGPRERQDQAPEGEPDRARGRRQRPSSPASPRRGTSPCSARPPSARRSRSSTPTTTRQPPPPRRPWAPPSWFSFSTRTACWPIRPARQPDSLPLRVRARPGPGLRPWPDAEEDHGRSPGLAGRSCRDHPRRRPAGASPARRPAGRGTTIRGAEFPEARP